MVTGSPSVAIRVYTPEDVLTFEEGGLNNADSALDGVDGLHNFRDSFEHSILFFVLHSGQQQRDQLGRRDSFVNSAQRSLLLRNESGKCENGRKVEFLSHFSNNSSYSFRIHYTFHDFVALPRNM